MRSPAGAWGLAAQLILGLTAVFYLRAAAVGVESLQYHRGIAVLFSLVAAFLLYRGAPRAPADRPSLLDRLLVLAAAVGVGYWIVEHEAMAYRAGAFTAVDVWMGVVVTVLSIEAARRVLGRPLAVVALLAIAYALFGGYLPTIVGHRGFAARRIVEYVYLTSDGIFGVMAEVVASFIFPFVVFGAFMLRAGVAKFFIDLAMAGLGRIAGGPAQVAVFSSALLGTINGSPIANTATTGSITIPLMKRVGFPPHIAAAVEAAASTGGMILPPIMGAGAFIMAEITGIRYIDIVKMSIVPGVLFFLSVSIQVYLESRKLGLRGLPAEDLPALRPVVAQGWYLFLPIVVLVALLLVGWRPVRAAVFAMGATVVVSWLRAESRMGPREVWQALVDGGRACTFVAAATGAIGIIIGILALTGIGIRFSQIMLTLAGDSLPLVLLLVAAASFILGMGLPITAAYLVVAVVAAPALAEFGVPLIAAHLIIFWLSLDSNITPPVALGAYTAAAIANADPWRSGWNSFRFAKMIYVMPLLFAYTHILFNGTPSQNAWAVASAVVGTVAFSIMSTGFFLVRTTLLEWLALAAATVLAFIPTLATDLAAIATFIAVFLWQRRGLRLATRSGPAAVGGQARRPAI
jgi:TRAP transporter 4TM/12TM fusion protein